MSSEYFTRTSLYLVRLKTFEWMKFLRRQLHQIQGSWACRNFVTVSRVASMQECIDERIHTTTNGFNLRIINSLMGSWGVRLTWLDYKLHKLAFTSKLLCFPTVLRLVPFTALNVFGYFPLMRALLSKRKNLFLINSAQLTTFPNL